MLHITAILEDTQIVLKLDDNNEWVGFIADSNTGRELEVKASGDELSAMMALALHHDGMPVDEMVTACLYKACQPFLDRYEMTGAERNCFLRPVP